MNQKLLESYFLKQTEYMCGSVVEVEQWVYFNIVIQID